MNLQELHFDWKFGNIFLQIIMNDKALKLRTDIEVVPVNYQGQNGIVIKDPLGLIAEPIFLYGEILEFMSLIDGNNDKRDIQLELIRREGGLLVSMDNIERLLEKLDDMFLLDNQRYQQAREQVINEYSLLKTRQPVLPGKSYPGDREELKRFLATFFSREKQKNEGLNNNHIHALVSPHIEIESGRKVYSSAYQAVAHLSPGTIILMGTGHALQQDFMSISEKDFETPLGIIKTDRAFVKELKQKGKEVVASHDMAHRSEHSLEIQLVFLQHLFGSEFTLVPLLFGSFDSEFDRVSRPAEIPGMKDFLAALKQYASGNADETLIVAGVDLSHIGPKFGHDLTAPAMLAETKNHDQQVIEAVCRGDVEELWEIVSGVKDRFNVCGFSTLACLLEILPGSQGDLLGYDFYNEEQTKSAVSFAAITMTRSSGDP